MSINFKKYDSSEVKKQAKNMKLSAHVNVTNPESMGFPYLESIKSFANLCEEVIVVDGGTTDNSLEKIKEIPNVKVIIGEKWERDFDWLVMAKNLNIGFRACKNQWVFHFDADYIFHEDDVDRIKEDLVKTHLPAIEIPKRNFVLVNEYFGKDNYPLIVNKGEFPAVCYGIGRTKDSRKDSLSFLRPIARNYTDKNGIEIGDPIKMATCRVFRSMVPVYTYDFTFMTEEQVAENRNRFDNALRRELGKGNASVEESMRGFWGMMKERHRLCQAEGHKNMKLEEHSKFIREKVANIKSEMFGHSGFGEL